MPIRRKSVERPPTIYDTTPLAGRPGYGMRGKDDVSVMDSSRLKPGSLLRQFGPRRIEYLKIWAPIITVVMLGFLATSIFVKPAPPASIVIASGNHSGAYHAFATRYAATFAEAGIDLVVKETEGTIENYRLITDPSSHVSAAIVQGGVAGSVPTIRGLESVGSLYFEPIWIFHNGEKPFTRIDQLRGLSVAIGPPGSGTRPVAEALLRESGMMDSARVNAEPDGRSAGIDNTAAQEAAGGTRLLPIGGSEAADALLAKRIDAAVFVISPTNAIVERLVASRGIHLMDIDQAEAYARRLPYLSAIKLPRAVLDIGANLPRQDVTLLAPAANLIVRSDIHASVVPLFVKAARAVHGEGGLVSDPGTFPTARYSEFPQNPAAKHYSENGSSFLFRVLPFWAASLADRLKIFALPLLTLLLPMLRIAPPLYRWRIRRRIYLWYRVLRKIDENLHLAEDGDLSGIDADIANLTQLSREVRTTTIVPLSYMQEFYQLRLHIEMARYRLHELLKAISRDLDPIQERAVESVCTTMSGGDGFPQSHPR